MSLSLGLPVSSSQPKKQGSKASHHLASGALSGFTSAICLQPLDLLKTRLQQGKDADRTTKRRIAPVLRKVLADDGVAGLWRGTIPTLARNVPGVALYFYTLSSIRTKLSSVPYFYKFSNPPQVSSTVSPPSLQTSSSQNSSAIALTSAISTLPSSSSSSDSSKSQSSNNSALIQLSSQGNLIAGALARTSVGFIVSPVTVLKARYESNLYYEYRSLWGAFRSLLATNGIRGLFQGFTATAARDAPYAGLYVVFYEKGKEISSKLVKPDWGIPIAFLHSGSAITASIMATVFTSPADCVKTRMQVTPIEHPTIRKAIQGIYADRGLTGFFSGSTLRISRKAASSAIAWTVYEALLLFLRNREDIDRI